jgi:hypothetical protein
MHTITAFMHYHLLNVFFYNCNIMYTIKQYSYDRAKKLGVQIKPSTRKNKKIDVFKKGKKIASIGALGYGDYPTFMQTEGMESANQHRKRYKIRHNKDRKQKGTPGYYADQVLW